MTDRFEVWPFDPRCRSVRLRG